VPQLLELLLYLLHSLCTIICIIVHVGRSVRAHWSAEQQSIVRARVHQTRTLNAYGAVLGHLHARRAAKENYPNSQYNFTWMVEQHGRDMGTHANMWRISQDIGE
jgi:hypothetical protein